jgi:archaellum component FlaG (FlaF/FlaG flagellin family)
MGLTGEKMVSPDESTTYILIATNEAGISDVKTITVTVGKEPADLVEIKYFTVNPDQISIGDKSTLCWDVSGVNNVTIKPEIGIMGLTGEKMVFPDESTTYILTATNEAGISDIKKVTVTVEKQMPELCVNPDPLDLNYSTMDEGDTDSRTFSILNTGSGTLEWSISNNQTWITVNPTSGINSGEVIVTVNTVKLKPGDYSGIITIESNGGNKNGIINLIKEGITTPTQFSPANGSIFDHYPRTTTLEWEAVLGAMSYTVEIDRYHYCGIDQWCTDIGETWKIKSEIQTTSYAFNYVNTEPGRWRVWAVNANGQESVKSRWWYFEYIV